MVYANSKRGKYPKKQSEGSSAFRLLAELYCLKPANARLDSTYLEYSRKRIHGRVGKEANAIPRIQIGIEHAVRVRASEDAAAV